MKVALGLPMKYMNKHCTHSHVSYYKMLGVIWVKEMISKYMLNIHIINNVSSHPLCEFEIDIMDTSTSVKHMRFGMAVVGIIAKIANAISINNKQADDVIRWPKGILQRMMHPKQIHIYIYIYIYIYADEKGSFSSTEYVKVITGYKLNHGHTSTHAPFTAEIFIRTFKHVVCNILNELSQEKSTLMEPIANSVNKYSNTEHNTVMIPVEAGKQMINY